MTEKPAVPTAADDLEAVLATTASVLDGVGADDWTRPTPCEDFDVAALVEHMVRWSLTYAQRVGLSSPTDAEGEHRSGDGTGHPAAQLLRDVAPVIVTGYRSDSEGSRALPLGIVLLDYVGHTWDLAVATGQELRLPDSAVDRALAAGRSMLTPDVRGDSFGPEVVVAADATGLERLVAFLGRDPGWTTPA
jgi:uncharacterized protein (TIGR03086 family)